MQKVIRKSAVTESWTPTASSHPGGSAVSRETTRQGRGAAAGTNACLT